MKIENIIYETTREIYSVEDKLRIATIFLFCEKIGSSKLSDLLYNNDLEQFIDDLQEEYKEYDIDLTIRLSDKNIHNSFFKTLEMVKEKWDANGYLKALYNRDPFALVIEGIIAYDFDKLSFEKMVKKAQIQLSLFD